MSRQAKLPELIGYCPIGYKAFEIDSHCMKIERALLSLQFKGTYVDINYCSIFKI